MLQEETSEIHLNDEHVESSDNLDIIINMYNLIEYSDNYEDSTASLYQFKRQEPLVANNANLTVALTSFVYKSKLLENAAAEDGNAVWKNARIIVLSKYVSSFFRSLKLPLINTKLNILLNYTKNSVISKCSWGFKLQNTKN